MLRRSISSGLLLSAAVLAAVIPSARLFADDAPKSDLNTLVSDFLHYSRVNNAELAKANADAILAAPAKPQDIWKAFEDVSEGSNYRDVMLQDQRRPDLKDDADKLLSKVEEGYRSQARNPELIRAQIENLANGPRAYQNSRDRLAAAGEYSVPLFLSYLQKPGAEELRPFILRAMGEIGRPLLNPLVEELRVSDPTLRIDLAKVLGQIGYPQALPALRDMLTDSDSSSELKAAVAAAITEIDPSGAALTMPPAELYLRGAQNYYDMKVSYQPQSPDEAKNPVWYFDKGLNNVTPVQVPTVIWNDVMALRMTEAALRTDPSNAGAISLWNAANFRRELRLPAGETDPTRTPNSLDASFYALAAGPQFMNPVLAMALNDHDNAMALKVIDVLEKTGGITGLVSGDDAPLVRALANPDRSVRFHAAFALARANPVSQYPSFFRIVPLLAEAVNSNSSPVALLVGDNDDLRNADTDILRNSDQHFRVYAGKTAASAVEAAQGAPAIDVVIVPNGPQHEELMRLAKSDYRLMGVPFLITAPESDVASLRVEMKDMKGHAVIDEKATPDSIKEGLEKARAGTPASAALGADQAETYATEALDLLAMLAADHRSIYSVSEIVPTLIEALKDKRPAVVAGAAKVLGELNSPEGEQALAQAALVESNPDRIMFFNELRESAKRTGNSLDAEVINGVTRVVSAPDTDEKLRDAAAGALGALNVPSNQASALILKQAR